MNNLTGKAQIRIRSKLSNVFAAFADPNMMSKFWFNRKDDGLIAGAISTWYLGKGNDAFSFEVFVKELDNPNKIVIEWERGDDMYTQVTWLFRETEVGNTMLTIEESGFTGTKDSIVKEALDSTAGFNQVIIAAKALIEHGVELSVVEDHV